MSGPGSSVGIATELRTGRSGIESRWGRDFPPVQTGPGAHPASCKMGTGSFLGVKCGRGVQLTTHPLLVPRSWKRRGIPLSNLWGHTGTVKGSLYFTFTYIYERIKKKIPTFPTHMCVHGMDMKLTCNQPVLYTSYQTGLLILP